MIIHQFQTKNMLAGYANFQTVRTAGVLSHIATQGRNGLTAGIGSEAKPVWRQRLLKFSIDQTRLNPGNSLAGIQ